MGGLRCDFCGKSHVQTCWDAKEAADCGNLSAADIKRLREVANNAEAVDAIRGAKTRTRKARRNVR